jgi:hypothetical protein
VRSSIEKNQILVDGFFMLNHAPEEGSWEQAYKSMIEQMQPGLNLMIVHPAKDNPEMQSIAGNHPDFGAEWRQKDLDLITSDAFREMIKANHIHPVTSKAIQSVM